MDVKRIIKKNRVLYPIAQKVLYIQDIFSAWNKACNSFRKISKDKTHIFYLGIPAHANLGDLAQGICIRQWISKHFPNFQVIEIETNALVNTPFSQIKKLKEHYRSGDLIVFQSGYTTTDLGGYADEMHRAVINALPTAKMLMMPQTIYFQYEENKKRTEEVYNSATNMLFLARDKVSYDMALDMFPDITVKLYPDIVTTLIGKKRYKYSRNGILFCCRNDTEKYYSDDELEELIEKCKTFTTVTRTDTTKNGIKSNIVKNAEKYIFEEIDKYAHYKLIITDRYHGTIFSLVAGTPVIIIKTTDHKVVTGAVWFEGVYDDYVYVAKDLEEAYLIARSIFQKKLSYDLKTYFEPEYYDKLSQLIEEV